MTDLIDRAIERYHADQQDDQEEDDDMPQEPADRDKTRVITIADREYVIIGSRDGPVAAYEFVGGAWEFISVNLWELGFSRKQR